MDFYCPRANLVIEVDGSQHAKGAQPYLDRDRNLYLQVNGIDSMRIRSDDLHADAVAQELCERFAEDEALPEGADESKALAYEIAIRSQIAIITLVKQGMLSPEDLTWTIDFTCDRPDTDTDALITCATEDLLDLLENICVRWLVRYVFE